MSVVSPLTRLRRNVMEAWALHVAVTAGVFEFLARPRTLGELSAEECLEADALEALLRALVACGYVCIDDRGAFGLSEPGRRFFVTSSPEYIGSALSMLRTTKAYEQYPRLLREGGSVGLEAHQWSYVTRGSALYAPLAVEAFAARFPQLISDPSLRVLDVGCGQAQYLLELLERNPTLTALGIDPTASVVEDARTNLEVAKAPPSVTVREGLLADVEDSFDVVMINQVFHVVGACESRALLEQARARVRPGGMVIVQEITLVADDPGPALFGFNMRLLFDHGAIFSRDEIVAMFEASHYRDVEVLDVEGPTPGLVWIVGRPG
jgi:SAM-dependent methyltransferase